MSRGPEEAAAELRELIREANGAVKDLRQVLREVRQAVAGAAAEASAAAVTAGDATLKKYERHIQQEMDVHTADLKESVQRARRQIVGMLMLKEVQAGPDNGTVLTKWAVNGNFDQVMPAPDPGDSRT